MKYHHPYSTHNRFRYKVRRNQRWLESVARWELWQAEPMVCFCFEIREDQPMEIDLERLREVKAKIREQSDLTVTLDNLP